MSINRREFIRLGSAVALTTAFTGLGTSQVLASSAPVTSGHKFKLEWTKESLSICPYCAVGCGMVVNTSKKTGRAINLEGDPDHPVNRGALCAKGASSIQITENPDRPTKYLWRAPKSNKWEEKSWEWCKKRIARLIKDTRDNTFQLKDDKGREVNRTLAMGSMGSAALDNEECWAMQTFMRSLGLVYIEHQARI